MQRSPFSVALKKFVLNKVVYAKEMKGSTNGATFYFFDEIIRKGFEQGGSEADTSLALTPNIVCIYRTKLKTYEEALILINEYIHFYNNERIQLKKLTPLEKRSQYIAYSFVVVNMSHPTTLMPLSSAFCKRSPLFKRRYSSSLFCH